MRQLKLLLGLLSLNIFLWGNPENPKVITGKAMFESPDNKTLNISASDKAVISWDHFSIDSSEVTYFSLPSAESVVLNRVTSSVSSVIAGKLQSNGEVYLINPNGVLITKEGTINTAAFLASTLDVADSQFLNGGNLEFNGDSKASIITHGQINTWNGDILLLSYSIENHGELVASKGIVAIGAGEKILMTPSGDQRIAVEISSKDLKTGVGIDQQGVIKALQAELKADGSLYALAIQHEGVINASCTETRQGRIYLVAPGGYNAVHGNLNVSGEDCPGGEVYLLGQSLALNNLATISASGTTGGTVYIGGGKQGRDPNILNADYVYVGDLVKVYVNSIGDGHGGSVFYWSEKATIVEGQTFLKGGPFGGDGGFIEVSSRGYLSYEGLDDRSSPFGNPGTLLLDPSTITINAAGPNANINFNAAPCAANTFCGTATNTSTIMISNGTTGLLDRLATGPVIVDSSSGTGTATAANASITIADPIVVNVNNPLTFNSSCVININAAVTNNGTSTITFNSAKAANNGDINIAAAVSNTSTGNIVMNSGVANTGSIVFAAGGGAFNSGNGNFSLNAGTVANGGISFPVTAVSVSNTGNGNMTLQTGSATSTGVIGTQAATSIINNGVSGTFTFNAKAASGTAISILGPITASSSGAFQMTASVGNITVGGTSNFTGGAPVTIQSTTGSVTLGSTSNIVFSGGVGPLTVTAQASSILGAPIDISYTGTNNIAVTNGGITATFTLTNSGSGTVNVTTGTLANGNITFNPFAGVTNSSSGAINLTGGSPTTTGTIVTSSTSTITNSGTGTMSFTGRSTATGNAFSLAGNITASSPGAFTLTATQGIISTALVSMNFTGGAPVTFQALAPSGGFSFTVIGGMNFSGGAGPLVISGVAASSISSPLNLAYTGTSSITVTNGTLTVSSTITNSSTGTLNISSGTLANGNISFGFGTAGLTNSGNGAINLSAGSPTTTGTITTYNVTNSGTSGTINITARGATNALNIQGPIVSSSSGAFTLLATQGSITSLGSATMNFTTGAPVTIQSSGPAGTTITLAGTSMSFAGSGGSLTVAGNTAVSLNGPITYSFSGAAQFSSATSNITGNAAANLTFNSGAGNVSFTTPLGNITTNASATILFNMGAGNLLMNAGTSPTNAGTISNGSVLTFNSGVGNTATFTAFGSITVGTINYGSTGNCQMTATGTSGSIATNSGTSLNWGPGGVSAGNLLMNASTSITTSGTISFSATSGVSSPALSMTAGTSISINGAVTYSSPFNWIMTNTNGTISNGTTAPITFNTGAGSLLITANATSGNSINLQSPIIYHTTSPASFIANTANITSSAPAVFTFDNGAPVTIQTMAAGSTITWGSGSTGTPSTFSGGAGPLVMTAVSTLALNGSTVYSYTSPLNFLSSSGSITINATGNFTANSGAGNVSFNAPQGSITINSASLLLFNTGAGNLTMTAGTNPTNAGSITSSGTITLNSGVGKTLTMTAYGLISLSNINDSSSGAANITAQNGSLSTASGTSLNWQSGGGNLSLNASTTMAISGNIVFDAGAGISSPALSMFAPGSITLNGAANTYASPFSWVIQNTLGSFTTGSASIITFASTAGPFLVTSTSGISIAAINLLGDLISHSSSLLQFIANGGPIVSSSTFSLIADNGAPVTFQATNVPSQQISLGGSCALSGGAGPLQVTSANNLTFSASLSYSDSFPAILTSTNGALTASGTFNIAGTGGMSLTSSSTLTISGLMAYTSTGNLNVTSTASLIVISAPIAMNTPATLFLTTSSSSAGNISIRERVTNSGIGAMTINCGRDFLVGDEDTAVSFQIGSAGGDLTFNIGHNLIVHAYGELGNSTFAQIGYHTGNINSNIVFQTIGGYVQVYAGPYPLTYALIGHGSQQPGAIGGIRNGNIIFGNVMNPVGGSVYVAAYDSSPDFGINSNSFAQIGHTRSLTGTPVTATGNIDLRFVLGTVTVRAENSLGAYALIGHGGSSSPQSDSYSGTVQVGAVGAITIQGGSFLDAFAGIGHMAILNAPGVVTLKSDLISVISSSDQILMQTGSGAEGVIGLYAKATAIGGTGVINATTPMAVPQITVSANNALILEGANPSDHFNGILIGALSYTGAIPFISAGDVGANITVTSGDLTMYAGDNGISSNTFAYILNGIGSPMGTFDITVDSAALSILGGRNTAAISSIGTLEMTATGNYLGNAGAGQALIKAAGNLTFQSTKITMNGTLAAASSIQTTSGNLTITTGPTQILTNGSISSGGTLNATLSGDFFMIDTATISSTGAYTITGNGRGFLAADGNVTITGSSTGNLSLTGDLYILADTVGSAEITSVGNLSVSSSAGSIFLINTPMQTASINSTSGSLTVSANNGCNLLNSSDITINGGSSSLSVTSANGVILLDNSSLIRNLGTGATTVSGSSIILNETSQIVSNGSVSNLLTVNTTVGNLTIENGCSIQIPSLGGMSSTIAKALNINAGSITSGNGGISITAGYINMSGASSMATATITASGGGLSLSAGDISIEPNSSVIGSGGAYSLNASGNLVVSSSILQNNGSGTTTITAGNTASFLEGAIIQGNTGNFTLSTMTGDIFIADVSTILCVGTLTITGMRDLILSNATIMSTLSVGGSTLFVTTARDLNLINISSISAQGGSGSLSVAATNGNLSLINAARISHTGTGAISLSAGDAAFIRGGANGDSSVTGKNAMTVNVGGDFTIESVASARGYLSSAGNTLITAGGIQMLGVSAAIPASITNSAGTLTVNGGNINMNDFSQIKLTAGSGTFAINTTVGDFKIGNGSVVQQQGTGALNCSIAKTLLIEGGPSAATSILGTSGGTISADILSLKGTTSAFNALISYTRGTVVISSVNSMNLDSHSKIALSSSSGADSLTLMVGQDLLVANDSVIQNLGINTPTTVQVTGSVHFLAGAGNAVLQGNSGNLSLLATEGIHFASDLTGSAFVNTSGNLSLTSMGDILFDGSSGSFNAASLTTSSGTITINASNNLTLLGRASFIAQTGSGLLTMNIGGDLNVENGSSIAQNGTGNLTSTIGGNLLVRGGSIGSAFISCNGTLNLNVMGDLNLEAISGAQAMIASKGTSLISANRLVQSGFDATSPALIKNTTGNLTINANSVELFNFGQIKLTAGTGILNVNANMGDLRIANGSSISNAGTGTTVCSVNNTLYIEGGALASASLTSGIMGISISAQDILMTGFSSNNGAILSASQGNLQVTTTLTTSLNPFATISLIGGSAALDVTVGSDLFIANGSSIQCGGSATSTIQVMGVATLVGGAGDSFIKGGTGLLSVTVGDNLRLASDINGKAFISSSGPVVISADGDISMLGAFEAALSASIQTVANSLSITAANSLLLYDTANISITAGSGVLTVNTTTGDLYIENGSFIQNSGTGAINGSIGGNAVIKSGTAGSSFISANGVLGLAVTGDLNLETAQNAKSYLFCKGNSTITASRLWMNGFNAAFPAYIEDTTGSLSVTAGSINMLNFATIKLDAGSSTLTVNASSGNFRIDNGSSIQHLGTGAISSTTAGTLYILGSGASSSIAGGTGGASIIANAILMSGASTTLTGAITAAQGALSITSMGMLSLTPFSKINLNGGTGNLTVNVSGTLYEISTTQIKNLGTGMTTITAGNTVICH